MGGGYKLTIGGTEYTIVSNTENTITVSPDWSLSPGTYNYQILEPIEIDYGDVLVLKGSLTLARAGIFILTSYNLDVNIATIVSLYNAATLNIQTHIIDTYKELLTLLPDQQLAQAKQIVREAISIFTSAINFIVSETDPQNNHLFIIDDPAKEQEYRDLLADLNNALDGTTPIRKLGYNLNLSEFFDQPKPLRNYLPTFTSQNFIKTGTFPDPTFGGIIPSMTSNELNERLWKRILYPEALLWASATTPTVSSSWVLSAVHFTSSNEGWTVGTDYSNNRGVLLHYSSGTWTPVTPPSVNSNWDLSALHFTSSNEGWAVGSDWLNMRAVLLHYSSGTWASVTPPSRSPMFLSSIHFTSANEGWAVGMGNNFLHYYNGSWTAVKLPDISTPVWWSGVYFTSSNEGWAVGSDWAYGKGVLLKYSSPSSCPPPALSYSPSPSDNAAGVSINPTLNWMFNSADSYDVYFGSTSNPVLVGNIPNPTYSLWDLVPNTTYYWKIVAKNACGGSTTGPVWSFTTGAPIGNIHYSMNPSASYNYVFGNYHMQQFYGNADDGFSEIYLDLLSPGFDFRFYGMKVNTIRVSTNGYVTFNWETATTYVNTSIPDSTPPNGIAAPFWDDLNLTGLTGDRGLWVGIFGTAPNRQIVLEWRQVPSLQFGTETYSFEVILYESTDRIKFQYLDVDSGTSHDFGNKATIGIENFYGTKGVQYSFNGSTPLSNGKAIEFIPLQAVVNCPGDSLQAAVDAALPGDIINVSGTCNENVLIRNEKIRFILDGQNVATIQGANSGSPTVNVRGKGIVIQNFEITGGSDGINVNRGSNAQIIHNNIHDTGKHGIVIDQLSFSVIKNNNIHNNPGDGILVTENSIARIGFDSDSDSIAGSNTIQNNGGNGITVLGTSNARIVGNTIANNTGDGIGVLGHSQADIASNTINNNGGNGISVSEKSGIQLGEDNPTTFFDQPNTTTVNNVGNGIACSMGAYVRGHLGSTNQINGAAGQLNISADCPQSLSTP